MAFRRIDRQKFDMLIREAKASPRKRKNFNFHQSPDEPIQRMLNALEPETYARPHRHHGRPEIFLCLAGKTAMFTLDDEGKVTDSVIIEPQGPAHGIEIEPDTWHTVVALESGTILYEVEQGPYDPQTGKEFAPWSPAEGEESGEGQRYNQNLLKLLGY